MQPRQPRPTPEIFYRRRRIAAAVLIIGAVLFAAGIGAGAQWLTGWSEEDWAAHTSVREPADYAPTSAVAITETQTAPLAAEPQARVPEHDRPLHNPPAPGQTREVTINSGGVERKMLVVVPAGAVPAHNQAGKPTPLILSFHGYRETPESMSRYTGFEGDGAIVVYPRGLGESWEGAPYSKAKDGQDVQFTKDILDAMSSTYSVDVHRIYAAGMSNGGGFAAKLACEIPEQFTAIAAVAGAYYPGTWRGCSEQKSQPAGAANVSFAPGPSVPFLEIHGRKDDTIGYDGGTRHGTPYLGAMQFSSLYAGRSGCFGAPITTRVTDKILRVQWPSCYGNGEVTHLAIADAGHTWPGETTGEAGVTSKDSFAKRRSNAVTATSEITAFFDRHQSA